MFSNKYYRESLILMSHGPLKIDMCGHGLQTYVAGCNLSCGGCKLSTDEIQKLVNICFCSWHSILPSLCIGTQDALDFWVWPECQSCQVFIIGSMQLGTELVSLRMVAECLLFKVSSEIYVEMIGISNCPIICHRGFLIVHCVTSMCTVEQDLTVCLKCM